MSKEFNLDKLDRSVTLNAKEWLYVIENLEGWEYLKEKIVFALLRKGPK